MNPTAGGKPRLVLFDLDHTLLEGDSDVLWCEFLMQRGVLERARFAPRNEAMEREYRAGSVSSGRMPPSTCTPITLRSVQQFGLPRRHAMQRPQLR